MGDTKIEWSEKVWNPVTGCEKLSAGCKHCYAESVAKRFWGERKFMDVQCHPERLEQPLHWRKPRKIFVCSMGDLFHDAVLGRFIGAVFASMMLAPQHTYQILTKRPSRMKEWILDMTSGELAARAAWARMVCGASLAGRFREMPWPAPRIWLGVSVENQETADERIPLLLQTPAAKRFVSYEPALGAVDFRHFLATSEIHQIICGGESGPKARPLHPDWARDTRDQCVAAGVPFFFKQWGEWMPCKFCGASGMHHGAYCRICDSGMRRVGKKAAGRELDGKIWEQIPE